VILKVERRKIEALETRCWRRTLKILWTDRVKNEEVFQKMNERKVIWKTIREMRKKMVWTYNKKQ